MERAGCPATRKLPLKDNRSFAAYVAPTEAQSDRGRDSGREACGGQLSRISGATCPVAFYGQGRCLLAFERAVLQGACRPYRSRHAPCHACSLADVLITSPRKLLLCACNEEPSRLTRFALIRPVQACPMKDSDLIEPIYRLLHHDLQFHLYPSCKYSQRQSIPIRFYFNSKNTTAL